MTSSMTAATFQVEIYRDPLGAWASIHTTNVGADLHNVAGPYRSEVVAIEAACLFIHQWLLGGEVVPKVLAPTPPNLPGTREEADEWVAHGRGAHDGDDPGDHPFCEQCQASRPLMSVVS